MADSQGALITTVEGPVGFNMAAFEMQQIAILKGSIDEKWPFIMNGQFQDYPWFFGTLQTLFARVLPWDESRGNEKTRKLAGYVDENKVEHQGMMKSTEKLLSAYTYLQRMEGTPFVMAKGEARMNLLSNFAEIRETLYQLLFDLKITIGKKESIQFANTKGVLGRIGGDR